MLRRKSPFGREFIREKLEKSKIIVDKKKKQVYDEVKR